MLRVSFLTDRSLGKKLGERQITCLQHLWKSRLDDESEHYELNFKPEQRPRPQTDHPEESVSEDIAWESVILSDRGCLQQT